jgi:hypothetical protein
VIDFFVPFMPLEKSHIRQCIEVDLRKKEKPVSSDIIKKVADQLQYSSPDNVFSTTGCKRVSTKVDYVIHQDIKHLIKE